MEVFDISTLNPKILETEFDMRGTLVKKSLVYQEKLRNGEQLPFDKIFQYRIGNPQVVGMKPLTYPRQVLSLCMYPPLLENSTILQQYPADVVQTARDILANVKGGVGAYSESQGAFYLRQMCVRYVNERDQVRECTPEEVFLTKGGSNAVEYVLKCIIRDRNDGVLIPIPQYPLYSALITVEGGRKINYYLDEEENEWVLKISEIENRILLAREQGIKVRALVVINPNNPAGAVFSEQNLVDIARLCQKEGIVLLSDEVYQHNIWNPQKTFLSMRKIVNEHQLNVKLFSIFSVSKGYYGECGFRGGLLECTNIEKEIRDQILKLASIQLCSNINGQMMVALICNPPVEGSPSFNQFVQEKAAILEDMSRISKLVYTKCNEMTNVSVTQIEGSMYAFPQIKFSQAAIAAAEQTGQKPDQLYALELLDATGIIFVPGTAFIQKEGTWHLRMTILGSCEQMEEMFQKWVPFNEAFHAKYP